MDRDYIARQVSATAVGGASADITVATDLPAEAKKFVVTTVGGADALTLTLTGPGTTYYFNYGINPWLKIDLDRDGATPVTVIGLASAAQAELIGYWI